MTYVHKNTGVCSTTTTVTIEDGIIQDVSVESGCSGNLQGVCALLKGRPAAEAIQTLRGIRCGHRTTSCPDQIALCLQDALAQQPG